LVDELRTIVDPLFGQPDIEHGRQPIGLTISGNLFLPSAIVGPALPVVGLIRSSITIAVAVSRVPAATVGVVAASIGPLLPGLVLAATLIAALESVAQGLVLTLVAGCQSLEQLLHIRGLRHYRAGEG
jgi:hypothetical protein